MELPEFPEHFHPEMPTGLRIALMSFVIREINSDFMNRIPEIKREVMRNNKNIDGVDAFLHVNDQIKKSKGEPPHTKNLSGKKSCK